MITQTDGYKLFIIANRYQWCWWCGRWGSDVPAWWYGRLLIERAHIVNNPRKCDERAVVALCSLCHKLSHGERFSQVVLPGPSVANMLWLKRTFDLERYDRGFLAGCTIGRLPLPKSPPRAVIADYLSRRGSYPNA